MWRELSTISVREYRRLGLEYQTLLYAGENEFKQMDNTTWGRTSLGATWFTHADWITHTQIESGLEIASAIEYQYDEYGHVTAEYQHGDINFDGDERSIHRWYNVNEAQWLVNTLGYERVYPGLTEDVGGGALLQAAVANFYDDATSVTTPPTLGRVTKVQQGKLSEVVAYTQYGYDTWGNVTRVTDPNGHRMDTTYDPLYHQFPIKVCLDPSGLNLCSSTHYYGVNEEARGDDFGLFGQVQKTYDNNGSATTTYYSHDTFGRLSKVARPGDTLTLPTVAYAYTDAYAGGGLQGLKVLVAQRETSGASGVLQSVTCYDGLGRAVQQRAETASSTQQNVVNTVYDALGRAVVTYAPKPESTTWSFSRPTGWDTRPRTQTTYDALGRVTQVTAPDNSVTRQMYGIEYHAADPDFNPARAVVYQIDANNHFTRQSFDAYGQLLTVSESEGAWGSENPWVNPTRTHYTYDTLGNLLTVTDAAGNPTTMQYDALGRKEEMQDPDMGHWTYTYDSAGNLKTQTDARGQVLWFGYDALNRLTQKRAGSDNGEILASYTYDAGDYGKGYRTGMSDSSGSTAWTYDTRGRVTKERKGLNGVGTFETQWGYDALDRVTSMKYPSNNAGGVGEQVNTTYAANGALYSVAAGANIYVKSTTYNAAGLVEERMLGDNVLQQDYEYYPWTTVNGQGRLKYLKTGVPGDLTSLQSLYYIYDAVGNVTDIYDYKTGSTAQRQHFTYDALDRLKTAYATGGAGGTYSTQTYQYDPIGNLTHNGSSPLTYPTPAPAGVIRPHAATAKGSTTYSYDANGNQTRRALGTSISTLTYDAENRLTTISGATNASFKYDGDGNRVKSEMGGVTTYYIGAHFEWTGSTSTMVKYYYAGGQRVAMRTGSAAPVFLLGDHLGSTSKTYNTANGATTELRYKPWGETRYTAGTTPTSFQYTGQRKDATGLYFYNARYYDPTLGRFLAADTIVPSPGNPQALNRYSYVLNNPLRYIDPSGHIAETEIDDANTILETLEVYGVHIKVDWGWVFGVQGDNTSWHPGLWQLSELNIILQAVKDFAHVAGGIEATQQAIGGITFERISEGATGHSGFGRITVADYTFNQSGLRSALGPKITIVHELAHYWDWKTNGVWNIFNIFNNLEGRIVQNFPQQEPGPTLYGRTSPCEAWAESVAGFVYPSYFAILRAEGSRTENYQQPLQYGPITVNFSLPGLTPKNRAYVEQQFVALQVTK